MLKENAWTVCLGMPEKVDKAGTWQWLSKSYLKIGRETLLCAAQ